MSKEAMQMALEALELYQSKSSVQMFDDAVKALRQALVDADDTSQKRVDETSKAEHEWVGLTADEIQDLSYLYQKIDASNETWFDRWGFARAIEAKLREKNKW